MTHRLHAALATLLIGPAAFAASVPDLATTITAPAGVQVYTDGRFNVKVANVGNKDALGVTVAVNLPPSHTSPQVFVLGTLGAIDPRCSRTGTVLNCSLGKIRKGKSTTVYFDIALPVSSAPLVFTATAPVAIGEIVTGNNSASVTAAPVYVNTAVSPPREAVNRHCTGTGLTAFFECKPYPSAISQHRIRFETNGVDKTIVFVDPVAPGYTGDWSQPSANSLTFRYYDGGSLAATFNGKGVGSNCYEGLTVFPGSPYVAPYEVCLQ